MPTAKKGGSAKKSSTTKKAAKKSSGRTYSPKASKSVEREMRAFKEAN